EKLLEIIGGVIGFILRYSLFDMLYFAVLVLVGLFAILYVRMKLFLTKSFYRIDIEVRSAQAVPDSTTKQNVEHLVVHDRFAKLVRNLKQFGWKIDSLQWIIEHIFKLILIIYFGYLTVEMCTPIILRYTDRSTASVINLTLNQPLHLKPA